MSPAEDVLADAMRDALRDLLARGFKLPFHFAWIAVNGSVMAGTYRAGIDRLECQITAQHVVSPGFAMPTNCMYVDADGEAARVVIGPDGERTWSN